MVRILLIDDDLDFLQALQDGLENLEHEVTAVDCGKKALQKFSEMKFDVVITDVVMNDGNGIFVIKSIRRSNSKIPIIVISGYNPNVKIAVERWGADKVLNKPFNIKKLKTALNELTA